jgi:hypothetical protein
MSFFDDLMFGTQSPDVGACIAGEKEARVLARGNEN